MRVSDMYCSKYLVSRHLVGKQLTVRIKDADYQRFTDDNGIIRIKPVLTLEGIPYLFILNTTNRRKLAQAWGWNLPDWIGHGITIGLRTVKVGDQDVQGLTVLECITTNHQGDRNE